ncbi:hypothetical protein GCM10025880_07660 [Methylorubrum aminovorans]|uniref:hypothetical protein n=1 Tax=Methylorubrum aminovorans TaxID=269069 RepID=UPI0023E976BD|nr:hypothetical protein [Methylorubrum aminovorans]GMA74349.1 hypothetical protein GCM10025880_07660 [Methylorubrum aminovorans]
MFTAAVARKTEKAFRIYRDLGLRSLVLRLARTLGRALGLSGAGEARWRARKEAVDVAFDAEAGVSTGASPISTASRLSDRTRRRVSATSPATPMNSARRSMRWRRT